MSAHETTPSTPSSLRPFPPVTQLATVALGCVVVGGILMASFAPRRPPLTLPSVLLAIAFVRNHTRAAPLALVTAMLTMFAVDVPLIISATVARYADPLPSASVA